MGKGFEDLEPYHRNYSNTLFKRWAAVVSCEVLKLLYLVHCHCFSRPYKFVF